MKLSLKKDKMTRKHNRFISYMSDKESVLDMRTNLPIILDMTEWLFLFSLASYICDNHSHSLHQDNQSHTSSQTCLVESNNTKYHLLDLLRRIEPNLIIQLISSLLRTYLLNWSCFTRLMENLFILIILAITDRLCWYIFPRQIIMKHMTRMKGRICT